MLDEIKSLNYLSVKKVGIFRLQYYEEILNHIFQKLKVWHSSIVFICIGVVVFVNVVVIVGEVVQNLLGSKFI